MLDVKKYMIKIPFEDYRIYLYKRNEYGKQVYVAKIYELKIISKEWNMPLNETIEIILSLLRGRQKRTSKEAIKKIIDLILFDPSVYFSNNVS